MDKRKRILVLGANSFIASYLIKELKQEFLVVGVYHLNKDRLYNDVVNFSITNLSNLSSEFEIVYLISSFIPGQIITHSDRIKLYETNVELVELICDKFNHSKIIYTSTVSVYNPLGRPITENDYLDGINEYAISKIWGERVIKKCKNYSIVRLSSVYGVGMKMGTIIPNYVIQAIKNNLITIFGDGGRNQDYIHVTDAVRFLKNAAFFGENEIYLATNSESISNLQLAKTISKIAKCNITFTKEDLSPSYYFNNEYSVNKLKFKPIMSFELGIEEIIKWLKKEY